MKRFLTLAGDATAELVIHKSRFIGACFPIQTEEEAREKLLAVKKRHYGATHNCYAYSAECGAIARFSDDGEPGGTAGLPMMEVIKSRNLTNLLVVVTRYFGGVLLGAGGLVRAYSSAATAAIDASGVVEVVPAENISIALDYGRYHAIEAMLRRELYIADTAFSDRVCVFAMVEREKLDDMIGRITEKTDGAAAIELLGEGCLRRRLPPG